MQARDSTFAAWHRADRNFFLAFVLVAWLGILLGFVPASLGRIAGKADYAAPVVLHVHAISFVLWMALLTGQVLLVRVGRTDVHRRLGMFGAALIPVMVLSGFFAEVYSQRYYIGHPPDSQAFFVIPIFYVIAFGVFATLAVARRRVSSAHKRLVYVATTIIVGAAWARATGEAIAKLSGDGYWGLIANTFTATNLLLLAAVLYDRATRGRVHPVLAWSTAAIVAGELLVSWIYHAPGWLPVARAIVTPLPGPPI
jgi:uncharacterized membrane protein